jgi:hypothetical protein
VSRGDFLDHIHGFKHVMEIYLTRLMHQNTDTALASTS